MRKFWKRLLVSSKLQHILNKVKIYDISIPHLFRSPQINYLLYGGIFIAFSVLSLPNSSESLPLQYSNYTSDKYQIQFQYPSDWTVKEKTNRFEEGTDISIQKITLEETGIITIGYSNETFGKLGEFGIQPVTERVYVVYEAIINDYTMERSTIEQPSFVNIDGRKAGTFVFTEKDRYDENAINWGVQMWLVYFGNKSWSISFSAPTTMFDTAKNVEIRDNFIKSMKFLGLNNATNILSR